MSDDKLIIKPKPDTPTGFIKARDVRYKLQGEGVNPKVQVILEQLADQASFQQREMTELAQGFEKMTDILNGMTRVMERLRSGVQDLRDKKEDN